MFLPFHSVNGYNVQNFIQGHCTTADGVAMSRRCQARRLVLNHIGHTYQPHSFSSSDLQPKAMQAKFGRSDIKLFVEVCLPIALDIFDLEDDLLIFFCRFQRWWVQKEASIY